MTKFKLEYIWLDGYTPVPNLRGKTQVKEFDSFPTLDLRNQLSDTSGQQSLWIERGLAPGDYGLDPTEYYLQDP